MSSYEVPEPILNSPFEEPREHWHISEGELPTKLPGRRTAMYFYKPPAASSETESGEGAGIAIELKLVNRIRQRVKEWREQGWPSATRTTLELLQYWSRDGREHRLFFAQLEAVETIIFLTEARADFLQGIRIPIDEPGDDRKADGYAAFRRFACKMATGSGKTTVMAMVAAWAILNKVNDRSDARFSDVVLVVCPNVTIRNRLQELKPELGEASIYRTRDLVPAHLMPEVTKGRVLIRNWHVFEPHTVQAGGVSAKVMKAGKPVRVRESITIGHKTTTARGRRYLTPEELNRQIAAGLLTIRKEELDRQGNLKRVEIETFKYIESDTALLNRVLGRDVGSKQNLLILNDEAHHAYRIRRPEPDASEDEIFGEEEESEEFFKEATVWIDGLDRIHKSRGINFCVDLSATPYFLARVGQDTNRPFPWVTSDFGLIDAIESGLVKIPQLAVRDSTGAQIPGYFNIWRWIIPKLTPGERGAGRNPKPEAILKWSNTPITMLAGLWEQTLHDWETRQEQDPRPPVFILVCKNTKIAKVLYEWLAEGNPPPGIPPAQIRGFRNTGGQINTIRVDSKVVHETDTGESKNDESAWMRFTLDTVGKLDWPQDRQGRPLYPEGFEEAAAKMQRPLNPPGRDIRCIVSVGMLTEGWDCNTVTHIVGLRPFMSQLLCEQVVGRALRRSSYEIGANGRLTEETAKVFGVPFEVIPFKENKGAAATPPVKRHHVHAIPEKAEFEIRFPRVEGYRQAIRNRIAINWDEIAPLQLDPANIPAEAEMKAMLPTNKGRPSLTGPGKLESVTLNPFRSGKRLQELVFELARDLTRSYVTQPSCEAPVQVLFPQLVRAADRFVREKVIPRAPAARIDVFLSPYYGWAIERLLSGIHADTTQGESPEVPLYETSRGAGSTSEVDFWTSRDVCEVVHSHLNYVVADTGKWEQSAAYFIDTHPYVHSFVKNSGLGLAIPYLHNGQPHDYMPDFIAHLRNGSESFMILETKGYDPLKEIKEQAALRWVSAVNSEGTFGHWTYAMVSRPEDVPEAIEKSATNR